MVDFLLKHRNEIISLITGLIYLFFSIRQSIWLWPLGIIASSYAVLVFYSSQLYSEMALNGYYIVISIYGWFHWLMKKDNAAHNSIKISSIEIRGWFLYVAVACILTVILAALLIHIPSKIGLMPSAVPRWDAFITAGSIVATWMLARKVLEQWLWWIVIDSISVGVFIYKHLYFMAALFVVYTIMSIVGYIKWKKDYKLQ